MTKFLKIFFYILLFSLPPAVFALDRSATPIPAEYFGMHIHRPAQRIDWSYLSIGAWRLHDANVLWRQIEVEPGKFDWGKLDAAVDAAASKNIDVLLPLGFTPAWAVAGSEKTGVYGPGSANMPMLDRWVSYVGAVAQRYRGRIHAYEIWNEINLPKFFSGTPAEMAVLTNLACRKIREIDPTARIVSSSPSGENGLMYWRDYLSKVDEDCLDILGVHLYTNHLPPETLPALIAKINQVRVNSKFKKLPIWNTESGWLIKNVDAISDPQRVGFQSGAKLLSDAEVPSYVFKAHLLAWSFGIDRFYWYAWDNGEMGFYTRQMKEDYAETVQFLKGALIKGCSLKNNIWTCSIRVTNSDIVSVAWQNTSASGVSVYTRQSGISRYGSWSSNSCDKKIGSEGVELTSSPILLCK